MEAGASSGGRRTRRALHRIRTTHDLRWYSPGADPERTTLWHMGQGGYVVDRPADRGPANSAVSFRSRFNVIRASEVMATTCPQPPAYRRHPGLALPERQTLGVDGFPKHDAGDWCRGKVAVESAHFLGGLEKELGPTVRSCGYLQVLARQRRRSRLALGQPGGLLPPEEGLHPAPRPRHGRRAPPARRKPAALAAFDLQRSDPGLGQARYQVRGVQRDRVLEDVAGLVPGGEAALAKGGIGGRGGPGGAMDGEAPQACGQLGVPPRHRRRDWRAGRVHVGRLAGCRRT